MATILHKTIPESRYIATTTVISEPTPTECYREFIGRVFSTSETLPFGKVVEVSTVDAAREYFGIEDDGSDIPEVEFAKHYFSFVNTDGNSPEKLSFARWCPEKSNCYLLSNRVEKNLNAVRTCTNTEIVFNFQKEDGSKNYSTIVNFSNVSAIQTLVPYGSYVSLKDVLNAAFAEFGGELAGTTADYVGGRLKIIFPDSVKWIYPCSTVQSTSGATSLASLLGLTEEYSVKCSDFCAGETEQEALTRTINLTDNFGSFCFFDPELTDTATIKARSVRISEWMNANKDDYLAVIRCLYCESRALGDIEDIIESVKTRHGMHLVAGLDSLGYQFEEILPMAILASVKYDADGNANSNWMFQQLDSLTATVRMENWAKNLDNAFVNYLGLTQYIAQKRKFYQRGVNLDGELASVYCAEMWLRDRIGRSIINGFLQSEVVRSGDTSVIGDWLATVFNTAVSNGTFFKPEEGLDDAAKLTIDRYFGGVKDAWKELEKDGYGVQIGSSKVGNGTWKVGYRLAYFHHNQIFRLEGVQTIVGQT